MTDTAKDVVREARDWIRQRDEHKKLLLTELEQAKARVAEVEATLAELVGVDAKKAPAPVAKATSGAAHRTAYAADATLTDLAVAVAASHPEGLTSGQLMKAILAIRPSAKPGVIYPAVYRARDQDRLVVRGKNYYLPKEAAE